MNNETHLREAAPTDAPVCARLIYGAGPILYNLLFGPSPEQAIGLFEALFALPQNPFSFENALVAERGGRVVGLALAADVAQRQRNGRRMMRLLPRHRGVWPLVRSLPVVLDIMRCSSTPPPDAYYLGILSVVPDVRGQGLGTLLIDEVHRRARQAGCPSIALHAELDNLDAQRFYRRHGYQITGTYPARRVAASGMAGFVSMARDLLQYTQHGSGVY